MYAYLDRTVRTLDEPDVFLLSAMRGWVAAARGGRCICRSLAQGFAARGVMEVLLEFATAMALLDRAARTKLSFAPLVWPKLTDDEARLLSLFALARDGATECVALLAEGLVREGAVPRLLGAIDAVGTALKADAA